jgi:hypothetical protein
MEIEKYKLVIDAQVCSELVTNGFELVDIVPSFKHKDRLVFVFMNSDSLEQELLKYDDTQYYR